MRFTQLESVRVFATDVREVALALGISPSPDEYVEIDAEQGSTIIDGRLMIRLTKIESGKEPK